eukprot:211496_1
MAKISEYVRHLSDKEFYEYFAKQEPDYKVAVNFVILINNIMESVSTLRTRGMKAARLKYVNDAVDNYIKNRDVFGGCKADCSKVGDVIPGTLDLLSSTLGDRVRAGKMLEDDRILWENANKDTPNDEWLKLRNKVFGKFKFNLKKFYEKRFGATEKGLIAITPELRARLGSKLTRARSGYYNYQLDVFDDSFRYRHDDDVYSANSLPFDDHNHYQPLIIGEHNDASGSGSPLLIGGVVGASAVIIIMLIFCLGLVFGMIIYWGYSQKRALDVKRNKGEMRDWIDDNEDRNEV